MDMPDFADPIAIEEIREFKTPPDLKEEAKIILTRHNCQIEEHPEGYLIHFPQGTTCARICRYGVTEHRRITLPDGSNCTTSMTGTETPAYFITRE